MALLNPPELRVSVMAAIVLYLSKRRGQRDDRTRLIDSVSPPTLSETRLHQQDVEKNLATATELGLVTRDGATVRLTQDAHKSAASGSEGIASHIRSLVLSPEINTAPWGSQVGARDLTNALAWFLTFSADDTPLSMEGKPPTVKAAQEADFGSRQARGDDDAAGWPIANDERWRPFQRWACSLGFAWRTPTRRLVPDPTVAIRDALPKIFGQEQTLDGEAFIAVMGVELPVLETGIYRKFVQQNWKRPVQADHVLTSATTDAIQRLVTEGLLKLEDRADAPRVRQADGSTLSHVSRGVLR